MPTVTLPQHLEAWAEAEVAAGRAESVDVLTAKAVAGYKRQLETFRASLEAAAAEVDAGHFYPAEQVFAELGALYPDES
jgi:Arc/MetJ-type ribon-helix-helix transcriptional regulator